MGTQNCCKIGSSASSLASYDFSCHIEVHYAPLLQLKERVQKVVIDNQNYTTQRLKNQRWTSIV